MIIIVMTEGSLGVKLPTIWADGKAEVRRVIEEKSRRWNSRGEKSQRRQEQKREE